MLRIENQEHFDKVKAFAAARGLSAQLQEKFDYLDSYANRNGRDATECRLHPDFAPYSFAFTMLRRDADKPEQEPVYWFNGGLIYFGLGDTGVDAPQYSVRLGDTSEGWSIHT